MEFSQCLYSIPSTIKFTHKISLDSIEYLDIRPLGMKMQFTWGKFREG